MSCISFLNLCPSSGDTEQVLLSKILQSLNEGGGGGAGVSGISINGGPLLTGDVSIATGSGVQAVNGDAGPLVLLDSGEIPEGANLYFTETRVRATVLTGFASALGAITAADSVLSAFGKAQGRLAALEAGTAGPFLLRAGDTGTGAFLFTPTVVDVVPLTLTSAVGSATTSSLFVATGGATNRLTIRNDGRFILAGRILATNTDVLGNTLNFSDAGTTNAPILLALGHTSTAGLGTAAAGFGAMLDWNLDSTTTVATRATRQTVAWTDATHATRTASTTFFAFTGGAETTQLTLVNNQIQGGNGTAALPTFSNRNDPNTGLYFSAADEISLSTAGTQRAFVNSAGNVSIGAATAPASLSIKGGSGTGHINIGQIDGNAAGSGIAFTLAPALVTTANYNFFGDGTNAQFNRANGGTMYFLKANVTQMVLSNAGQLGVGPSETPGANLDINNAGTTTVLRLYHTTDGAASPANYSRIALSHNAAGAGNQKANFAAETGGTGADNIDVRLSPAGTGGVFLDAGIPLVFASGTNTRAGNATLVGGTVTVANTTVTANTIVMLTRKTSGGTVGFNITYTVSAATSFTITSDSALDTSTFSYLLIENHAS